jgi:hypothetical protein
MLEIIEIYLSFKKSLFLQENDSKERCCGRMCKKMFLGWNCRLADEVARVEEVGTNKLNCGCFNRTIFGLSCTRSLAKTIKEGKSICLSEICIH